MIPTHNTDPIVEEIHQTRRQMAERFGGDVGAILGDARKRQAAAGRPVWRGKSSNQIRIAVDLRPVAEQKASGGRRRER